MNEGLKEVESSKDLQRWLVFVIIFTCLCWIGVWADFAFGYISWTGSLTICNAILPGFSWVWIAQRYNKIDQRLADLSAVVLSVTFCILMALHILSPFY
jgi:O-antigen/teichoic acid export membrane protein